MRRIELDEFYEFDKQISEELKNNEITTKDKKAEQLAEEIAQKLDWDGLEISKVFMLALTDANFHTLRKEIEEILKREFDYEIK